MNDACCLWASSANRNGPGAHFFDASGEIGLQAKQAETSTDQTIQAWFFHAHIGQEGFFVGIFQIGNFSFDSSANGNDRSVLLLGVSGQLIEQGVVGKAAIGHVGHIHGWLGGN